MVSKRSIVPFPYVGGKAKMSKWIIEHLPEGHLYVEPFAGCAAVFFNKPPHKVEVLNDLNHEIINFYRVLQNPVTFDQLLHRLEFTLCSHEEFCKAIKNESPDPVDRAWCWYVKLGQGFGGIVKQTPGSWGISREGNQLTGRFHNRTTNLPYFHSRLKNVSLDCRDAVETIKRWDHEGAVFYCDPPYIEKTRKVLGLYAHDSFDHNQLVETLLTIKGKAILSGYDDGTTYQRLEENGWVKFHREAVQWSKTSGREQKDRSKTRAIETIWVKN